jgi:diguanylate cyclase (GGDEF)-like protein/PAS domain S-box-containing protein
MLAWPWSNDYRELFLRHPQPLFVYERETLRILDVNDAACAEYGYERAELLRRTLWDIRPEADRVLFGQAIRQRRDGRTATSLWRHQRADGSTFYADVTVNHLTFEGRAAGIVCTIDASQRLAVSRALSDSRAALADAQELAHLGSFEIDLVTGETRWSPELYRLLGVDPAREQPTSLRRFDHPDDGAAVAAEIERARTEHDAFSSEHRIRTRDGRELYVIERGRYVFGAGKPRRAIGVVLDITEHKKTERRLRQLAERDSLTGLPNRGLLRDTVQRAIERAGSRAASFAIVFVDLDRFKRINDTMAHAAGDDLLRTIATRMVDVIGERGVVARAGGDEFAIVLDGIEDETAAVALGHEVLGAIARPHGYESARLFVTASIGIALFPRDGTTPDELLSSADTAMFRAKGRGGNAVATCTAETQRAALAELELEGALRDALERGLLQVAYQPIVDANSGAVVGLEALARWSRDGLEIYPETFIPLAESRGLILSLGGFVLERAAAFARELNDAGFPLTMSVNLSPLQFRDPALGDSVRDVLDRTGLPPGQLQLELTETAYIGPDSDLRSISEIEKLGVRLSIDDFGTGYSSLGYLKHLPVNSLKIDRSFVRDILTDVADQAIVRAVIAVAANLALSVVAEGVETRAQADYLRGLGCTHFQGYHFAYPLEPMALRAFLKGSRIERSSAEGAPSRAPVL